jgi:hypothetical protein
MRPHTRVAILVAALGCTLLLSGCPGMPGAPGGQQKTPPGMMPPAGLESGGAYSLMGTTITAPDDSILLFRPVVAADEADRPWETCRRIILLENAVLVEGINYDGRTEDAEKDFNRVIPLANIQNLNWKYESKPRPPAEEESEDSERGD